MIVRTVSTLTHGRYLVSDGPGSAGTLVGFHGYKEHAAAHLDWMQQIAGEKPLQLVSVQGLHRFYARGGPVVASWMTSEDRELAIADNIAYVTAVLSAVSERPGLTRPLFYVGFSQGVAMAYRAAASVPFPCDGIIALGGDLPPDVAPVAHRLPRTLIGRGQTDAYYTETKAAADLAVLRAAGVSCTEHVFDGGHEWTPHFVARAAQFLEQPPEPSRG